MSDKAFNGTARAPWRKKLGNIIFDADTPAGKAFDIGLLICIVLSVAAVMLDSVEAISRTWGGALYAFEWVITILFTIEYALRLASARDSGRYARSFFGVVDLVAILPTYFSLLLPGSQYLIAVRVLRVLRVFRVLKFVQYVRESAVLVQAFRASRRKIAVFLLAVFTLVIIVGSLMYLIEGEQNGFTSIPRSVYWAIVTVTTVGYGDISPKTAPGQVLAALLMITGYGVIAVPTGIVSVELSQAVSSGRLGRRCPGCNKVGHSGDAKFCSHCGTALTTPGMDEKGPTGRPGA